MAKSAVIVGAGSGISASVARRLAERGYRVCLAARSPEKLAALADEIGGVASACDAADPDSVAALFDGLPADEPLGFVLYNASARQRAAFADLDPDQVRNALMVSAYGGFLVAHQAVRRMLPLGSGAVFFTGASASVKGYAHSAPFAMGKFALRGMAQSMARELHPKGLHIAHFVIDGGVRNPNRPERVEPADRPDSMLDPDAIADTYMAVLDQNRSAWSWEVEVRPWVESF
ncbi:MAG: SDR family NAD(P)-dependent oxidoreductase [Pseudomonadota bacterium]